MILLWRSGIYTRDGLHGVFLYMFEIGLKKGLVRCFFY